jgi:hypothetical protein
MPPLVFDFASIASRLRKDDFYSPQAKPTPVRTLVYTDTGAIAYQCHACDTWFDRDIVVDGKAICPNCNAFNRCYFV